MRSKQEIFDYVVNHLYTQGKPAKDFIGNCVYRNKQGLMCAVGCLIPDDVYVKEMEGESVGTISEIFDLPAEIYEYKEMLRNLQGVHDGWTQQGFEPLVDYLVRVAEIEGIVFNDPRAL